MDKGSNLPWQKVSPLWTYSSPCVFFKKNYRIGDSLFHQLVHKTFYADVKGCQGSVCQGWAVDWALTDLQNGPPNGGLISTPLWEGVKSGRSGAHKPDKLGMSCKANKYSHAGTGDLCVLPTQETSSLKIDDAGSTSPGGMPPQVSK